MFRFKINALVVACLTLTAIGCGSDDESVGTTPVDNNTDHINPGNPPDLSWVDPNDDGIDAGTFNPWDKDDNDSDDKDASVPTVDSGTDHSGEGCYETPYTHRKHCVFRCTRKFLGHYNPEVYSFLKCRDHCLESR